MNPQGIFRGNTFLAEWTAVQNAKNYSVTVEQCNDSNVCHQVKKTQYLIDNRLFIVIDCDHSLLSRVKLSHHHNEKATAMNEIRF